MIEAIRPDIFRIEIRLPDNPLKALNSYIIKSPERNLIIDTGMNRPECLEELLRFLKELNIDLDKTDIFITHMHSDHSGLITALATDNTKVYCHKDDAEIISYGDSWDEMLNYALKNGFPEEEDAIGKHPGYKYCDPGWTNFTFINDQDVIKIGNYNFTCIHTPGHTKGHMCLYEKNQKILVSGDHILFKITPNISLWDDEYDALSDYLNNLNRVYEFEVELVLPSHRKVFNDHRERIEQLKQHHDKRLNEILNILSQGPQNAFEIASKMKWDLSYKVFDDFPTPQKWFATGEVISHLKYLKERKLIMMEVNNNDIKYCLTK